MTRQHLWKLVAAAALAVTLAAPGASLATPVFDSPVPHPPTNDNFDSAIPISILSLPYSDLVAMGTATTEANEPQYCNWSPQTVWYSYTPTT